MSVSGCSGIAVQLKTPVGASTDSLRGMNISLAKRVNRYHQSDS